MKRNDYAAIMRATAVLVGLMGIIAVHVLDLPGKFEEVPYLGVAYLGIIAAAGFLITRIMRSPSRLDFLAAAGLAASVIAGFAINRTVGMPGATDDIGNWLEPLGLLSLVIEGFVVWAALAAARGTVEGDESVASAPARERVLAG